MIIAEIISLILILSLQFRAFFATRKSINALVNLFPSAQWGRSNVDDETHNDDDIETIVIDEKFDATFQEILGETNAYLVNNHGSADFGIIRSLAERETETQEAQIVSSVSIPLYLGLMGTFFGVILGLSTMLADSKHLLETMEDNISSLLLGVCVAMGGSFMGLALTTWNNARTFKNAVVERDKRKNRYFNFLQVYLLPNLDNNLYSALSALKQNINGFNERFAVNLENFDKLFGDNIGKLGTAVSDISGHLDQISDNTKIQVAFLEELKTVNYNQIAKANLNVLSKLEDVSPLLAEFIAQQKSLNDNVRHSAAFAAKVGDLFDRISEFEKSINGLGQDLTQRGMIGNDMILLVQKQLSDIGRKEAILNEFADKAENEVKEFLRESTVRIAELKRTIERDFERAFDFDAKGNILQNMVHLKTINETLLELKSDSTALLERSNETKQAPEPASRFHEPFPHRYNESRSEPLVRYTGANGESVGQRSVREQDNAQSLEEEGFAPEINAPDFETPKRKYRGSKKNKEKRTLWQRIKGIFKRGRKKKLTQ